MYEPNDTRRTAFTSSVGNGVCRCSVASDNRTRKDGLREGLLCSIPEFFELLSLYIYIYANDAAVVSAQTSG